MVRTAHGGRVLQRSELEPELELELEPELEPEPEPEPEPDPKAEPGRGCEEPWPAIAVTSRWVEGRPPGRGTPDICSA